ncbi:DUF4328 domain-containing protein [Streptomyces sp. NPDC046821]|uniref:DUF4328 domain-containing protein n=1 Tax=Streptomyces sp. NPDC046821 TaxID=3154702 RepID=UPI0033C01F07
MSGTSAVPAPRGTARLKSPVGVSMAACVLLGVVIASDLFSLWAGFRERSVVADLMGGVMVSDAEADSADRVYAEAARVQWTVLLVTAVVFIVWFQRVRINAEVFRPDGHTKVRAWAVWGWLVPLANVYIPWRIARDTWDASLRETGMMREKTAHAVINCWWTLWLVGNVFDGLAAYNYDKADSLSAYKSSVEMSMVADGLDIAAAVAAIVFVRTLTRMQKEKALRGPAPLGGLA